MAGADITIYTDGAARGNPGLAAAGCVIFQGDTVIAEIRQFLGTQTNNWAEYEAVALALLKVHELNLHTHAITMYLDSKLVVEQLSGNWKIKTPTIQEQYNRVQHILAKGFTNVRYEHVPRAQNAYADRLANEAIDSR